MLAGVVKNCILVVEHNKLVANKIHPNTYFKKASVLSGQKNVFNKTKLIY